MLNKATVIGRVGKIETKTISTGTKISNLSIVTTKKFMKNGVKEEKITWHNITLFQKLSEIADQYVSVGDMLYVEGEMEHQKYMGQDGQERSKFFIIGHDIKMFPRSKEHKPEPKAEVSYEEAFQDSDVPF